MSAFHVLFAELETRLTNIALWLRMGKIEELEAEKWVDETIAVYQDRLRTMRIEEKRLG